MWKHGPSTRQANLPYLGQALSCDTEARFVHVRSQQFVALWRASIPVGRRIPSRKDLPPEKLRDFLPYLAVMDMDDERQRYRFRLVGTEVTARTGRDATGYWLDSLYSEADMAVHRQTHQWIIEHRQPVRIHGTLAYVDRSFIQLEAAVVPLAVDTPDYVEQFIICMNYGDLQEAD